MSDPDNTAESSGAGLVYRPARTGMGVALAADVSPLAWPDDCGIDLAAEKAQAERIAADAAAWRSAWPRHCRACGGWGGHGFTEMHGFKGGSGEQQFDPCGALENPATCHRCGLAGLTEDSEGPCTHCAWDYNDGEPQQ